MSERKIILENEVWVQDNVIYFHTDLNEHTGNYFKKLLLENKNKKNLTVDINSPGGSLEEFRSVYNLMKHVGVKTVCYGYMYSAGFYMFLAGVERVAVPGCRALYHQLRGGHSGTKSEMNRQSRENDLDTDWLHEIVMRNSNFTKLELEEIDNTYDNHYMRYEELVQRGIVTKEISEDSSEITIEAIDSKGDA